MVALVSAADAVPAPWERAFLRRALLRGIILLLALARVAPAVNLLFSPSVLVKARQVSGTLAVDAEVRETFLIDVNQRIRANVGVCVVPAFQTNWVALDVPA